VVLADKRPHAVSGRFARPPYAASFLSSGQIFIVITLHVIYGHKPEDRIAELTEIAQWLRDWAEREQSWGHNLICLGDFNIDRAGDPNYQAFTSTGLTPAPELEHLPRTIFGQDQSKAMPWSAISFSKERHISHRIVCGRCPQWVRRIRLAPRPDAGEKAVSTLRVGYIASAHAADLEGGVGATLQKLLEVVEPLIERGGTVRKLANDHILVVFGAGVASDIAAERAVRTALQIVRDFCIPPPPPDLDCPDVAPHHDFTVVGSDPHNFDSDGDVLRSRWTHNGRNPCSRCHEGYVG
jgi:hypothetical protein